MAEDSREVKITYETLYEILRREKSHDELQKLDETFFNDVVEYLKEKHAILQEAAGKFDMFSVDERDNTQTQLNNVRRILKELYERREKKIIEMALNKSRTNSNIIDTTNLIGKERTAYQELINLFDGFRKDILFSLLEMKQQDFPVKLFQETEQDDAEDGTSEDKTAEELPEQSVDQQTESKTTKKIRFTQKVDEFVGPDLNVFGPFEPEQIEELPKEIAEVLLSKGSAVIVE